MTLRPSALTSAPSAVNKSVLFHRCSSLYVIHITNLIIYHMYISSIIHSFNYVYILIFLFRLNYLFILIIYLVLIQQLNPLFDKFMHMDVSCSGNLLLSSLLPLNDTQRFIFSSDDPLPTSFHPSDHTPPCLAGCASNKSGETLEGGMVHELGCPVVSSLNRKPVNINKLKGLCVCVFHIHFFSIFSIRDQDN